MSGPATLAPQPTGIPVPVPSARSQPFWDGCREGRLVLPLCSSCGTRAFRAFAACAHCHRTTLTWAPSDGRGSLYSWTVVWRPPHPSLLVPYAPAVIALDEGWWFMSAVVGCTAGDLQDGMALQVEFHAASESLVLPYFRPLTG